MEMTLEVTQNCSWGTTLQHQQVGVGGHRDGVQQGIEGRGGMRGQWGWQQESDVVVMLEGGEWGNTRGIIVKSDIGVILW